MGAGTNEQVEAEMILEICCIRVRPVGPVEARMKPAFTKSKFGAKPMWWTGKGRQ